MLWIWNKRCRLFTEKHAVTSELDLPCSQKLKAHDDESEDSNGDIVFDAFAEELYSNWYDFIKKNGKTFNCLEFLLISSIWNFFLKI